MNIKKMREDFDSSMEPPDDPTIVCLCGSTRFGEAFAKANLEETLAGRIVLTIGCNMKSDSELFGSMSAEELKRVKTELDELHKRKIDIADEVLVLNVGGYIGESTRSEIEYAKQHGKKIRYLTPQPAPVPTLVDDTCECRTGIYSAIDRERDYQDKKWGKAHDSEHTVAEFLLIIELELVEAK